MRKLLRCVLVGGLVVPTMAFAAESVSFGGGSENSLSDPNLEGKSVRGAVKYDMVDDTPMCILQFSEPARLGRAVHAAYGMRTEVMMQGDRPRVTPIDLDLTRAQALCTAITLLVLAQQGEASVLTNNRMGPEGDALLKIMRRGKVSIVARDLRSQTVLSGEFGNGFDHLPTQLTVTPADGQPLVFSQRESVTIAPLTRRDVGRGLKRHLR